MFKKILIANRGEIACRIIETAKEMGIKTVALYSDADNQAKHVTLADESYYIGASAPAESYLKGEQIIAIAKKTGAQAIHPGYGFLSENAEFAASCEQQDIVFIGPTSAAIAAMGSKSQAKNIMANANVPLVPGYHGDEQSDAVLLEAATHIEYPLLIKAAYGGGGKGMRIVEQPQQLQAAIDSARREAKASFGNDKLLLERYITQPRHVEVQVFADQYGHCIYLSDRDCSVQRRHQKVIEEAPAPGLSPQLRSAMGEAAVAAAKAIDYRGAGTVEFLLDNQQRFYFMEMNTRLQVEHPVTELVTGQDLVKWQLIVASGGKLPLTQAQVQIHGHAFESRIYAEDPNNDFLPACGHITFLKEPVASQYVRIDSGVRQHDEISNFYDPMIAKLITWDENRLRALQRMQTALTEYKIAGLNHNIEFLSNIAEHPAFINAELATDFIERHQQQLIGEMSSNTDKSLILACLYQLCIQAKQAQLQAENSQDPTSPWAQTTGFRLNRAAIQQMTLVDDEGKEHPLTIYQQQQQFTLTLNDQKIVMQGQLVGNLLHAQINGHKSKLTVAQQAQQLTLFINGLPQTFELKQNSPLGIDDQQQGGLTAPMSGTIVSHLVEPNAHVTAGQGLMVMEAMKMEYTINAPADGQVDSFFYQIGEQVSDGALLLEFIETEAV